MERGRHGQHPCARPVPLLPSAVAAFQQTPGKDIFKLRPRLEGAASWEGQERMESIPWGIWLFTLYRVARGHRPVPHILCQGKDWQPHCSFHAVGTRHRNCPLSKTPLQLWDGTRQLLPPRGRNHKSHQNCFTGQRCLPCQTPQYQTARGHPWR